MPTLPGMAGRGGAEHALDRRLARAEHGEPRAARDQPVDALAEEVHALLPAEPADHAEQEAVAGLEAEAPSSTARLLAARRGSVAAV